MKTREFDPVLSAALRNELESLADGAGRTSAVRSALRRPQVWITAATALVLLVATLGVLRITTVKVATPAPAATGATIADPLAQITDPSDPAYVADSVLTLLHTSGTGATTIPIDVPSGVTSVRPLIRCAPDADFRITIGKAYWTSCSARTTPGYADIPVTSGRQDVVVAIPKDVAWKLVVIATPDPNSTTTYATLEVTTPTTLAYPDVTGLGEVVGRKRGIGAAAITGRLDRTVQTVTVVVTCQGDGLDILIDDESATGPQTESLCSPNRLKSTTFTYGTGASGRPTFRITPTTEAYWTVTFVDAG